MLIVFNAPDENDSATLDLRCGEAALTFRNFLYYSPIYMLSK